MSVKEKGKSYQTTDEYFKSWQVVELLSVEGITHDFNPITASFFQKEVYEVTPVQAPVQAPVQDEDDEEDEDRPVNDYTGKPLLQFFREGLFG